MKVTSAIVVVSLFIAPWAAQAASAPVAAPSTADAAFLAQLGVPAPVPLAGCSASVNCFCKSGNPVQISCTGTTTCRVVFVGSMRGVECDGVVVQVCPGPTNC